MISIALATALHLASAPPAVQADPTIAPRRAFAGCLTKFVTDSLRKETAPAAFDAAVQQACASQETAFRSAMIAFDIKGGFSRAEAEENADFQVDDYLATTKDTYLGEYEAHGGAPTPQPAAPAETPPPTEAPGSAG